MKRAVLYTRVSTCDQNPEMQALDLRRLAEQRGFEIVHEYTDRISGAKKAAKAIENTKGLAVAYRSRLHSLWDSAVQREMVQQPALAAD
jgi:DNA invertase Pin-like site-specific DNA recombinase